MTEKQIVNILIPKLLDLDFIVHRYNSYTTNSIYIKLDYGVSCGIRIADHRGKAKYRYRFNLLKDYKGNRVIRDGNLIRFFYSFEDIESMLLAIKQERHNKIEKYGITKYKAIVEKESQNELFNRFIKIEKKGLN